MFNTDRYDDGYTQQLCTISFQRGWWNRDSWPHGRIVGVYQANVDHSCDHGDRFVFGGNINGPFWYFGKTTRIPGALRGDWNFRYSAAQ